MLGSLFSGRWADEEQADGYTCVDRDPALFPFILHFLRCGEVLTPLEEWERSCLLNEAAFYGLDAFNSIIEGRYKLYTVGGWDGKQSLATAEVYCPITDSWTALPAMPTTRRGVGVAVVRGRVYAFGGRGDVKPLATVEMYDAISNEWCTLPNMLCSRSCCAVGVVGDQVYVIGGWDGRSILATGEVYDTVSMVRRIIPEMSTQRSSLAVGVLGDRLYAIGGWDGSNVHNTAEMYNLDVNIPHVLST